MSKPNSTTNSGKNPVDRIDAWATGHFDFLLDKPYGEKFRKTVQRRIESAKRQYAKFKKEIDNHYPNNRKGLKKPI